MSVWTGTNRSPGPRRLMKTPSRSTLPDLWGPMDPIGVPTSDSPKGARGSGVKRAPAKKVGILTEVLG
jgi:hypothetical protein